MRIPLQNSPNPSTQLPLPPRATAAVLLRASAEVRRRREPEEAREPLGRQAGGHAERRHRFDVGRRHDDLVALERRTDSPSGPGTPGRPHRAGPASAATAVRCRRLPSRSSKNSPDASHRLTPPVCFRDADAPPSIWLAFSMSGPRVPSTAIEPPLQRPAGAPRRTSSAAGLHASHSETASSFHWPHGRRPPSWKSAGCVDAARRWAAPRRW